MKNNIIQIVLTVILSCAIFTIPFSAKNHAELLAPSSFVSDLSVQEIQFEAQSAFSELLGISVIGLIIRLARIESKIEDIFSKYDKEFRVFVLSRKLMEIVGEIGGMDQNGRAFNFKSYIFVLDTDLERARQGDKEALLVICHERCHNDYRKIHGDQNPTVEQRLADELYAYFSSFIQIYGVPALAEIKNREGEEVKWGRYVYYQLARNYLWDVETREEKTQYYKKIAFAINVLYHLFRSDKNPQLILENLKTMTDLNPLLVLGLEGYRDTEKIKPEEILKMLGHGQLDQLREHAKEFMEMGIETSL